METLLTLDNDGAHIASEEITDKLAKKNISPSLISSLEGCAARWVGDSYAVPLIAPPPLDNPATRGSLFHYCMEEFFKLPPEQRTPENMRKSVKKGLTKEEFAHFSRNADAIQWLRDAVNNYYNMGAKPEKVSIAEIDGKPGIETFVKGRIGDTKRSILGFVDRIVEDPKVDGAVVVEDWKTGAKAKHWNGKLKSSEGINEQRQQSIYANLLRQKGIEVSKARLIYPVAKTIVNVQLENEELQDKIVKDIEKTDKTLTEYEEENFFPFKPDFLCAWCPLAKICPAATIKPYKKMQEAYAKQPDVETLSEGIERI